MLGRRWVTCVIASMVAGLRVEVKHLPTAEHRAKGEVRIVGGKVGLSPSPSRVGNLGAIGSRDFPVLRTRLSGPLSWETTSGPSTSL